MKKSIYLGIIALATLSLASCSKDEVVESVPQQPAIEFGTYLGRDITTRGTVWNDTAMKEASAGFGVFAFYTGQKAWASYNTTPTAPNFMYNQNVEWVGSAWTYSPKKYWPATQAGADADKITFFAYAPMASTSNGLAVSAKGATGTPTVTYTIDNTNLDKMADFVADALIDETKKATDSDALNNVNEPVVFTLNHELTRVNITAQLDKTTWNDSAAADKTKVNIKSIKFYGPGFATSGTYTFASINDVTSSGTTTVNRGSWSYTPEGDTKTEFLDLNNANFVNWTVDDDLANVDYTEKGVFVTSTTATALFKTYNDSNNNQYLFLIPPYGSNGVNESAGKGVYMDIKYDIVTVDTELDGKYSCTPATKRIVLPNGTLKQGVAYTFNLIFGMNEITLSATVDGWNDPATGLDEDVDYDDTDIY